MANNRRQNNRIASNFPIDLQIDQQITIQGTLKNITPKSAFVAMKSSVYIQVNDEFQFLIKCATDDMQKCVKGTARISRIAPGEGIAIYFTDLDSHSSSRLHNILNP